MPIYKGNTNQGLIYYGSPNTNCLTSVPKNINITYNAGVFTVHSGSIITVPYGGGTALNVGDKIGTVLEVVKVVGNYIQLKLLKDFSDTFGGDTSVLYMLTLGFTTTGGMYWSGTLVSKNTSGSTDSNASNSDGCLYFDTTNNIIYRRYSNGTTGYQYGGGINGVWISLPIACHYGAPTKAEQIFDWCGFIGSTAFVLPGVKGLKSNGIKADGTYNNIEVETKSVLLNNYDYQATGQQFGLGGNGNFIWRTDKYYSKPTAPTPTTYSVWHNTIDNFNYFIGADASTGWVKNADYDFKVVNSISTDSSFKITSLVPTTVQPLSTGITISNVYKGSTLVYRLGFDPVTFTENGTWTVPAGIRKIAVDCVAASGSSSISAGGKGGRVQCVLNVASGQVLHLVVGKEGANYNASDIRTDPEDLNSRLIVAGAGGNGAGGIGVTAGAAGGGLVGASAGSVYYYAGGSGGTQTAGGSVGGTFGFGGSSSGGHGGAGWYGGGAGQAGLVNKVGTCSAGGGGGSSYTHPELCSEVVHTQGFQSGNGYITISMV